MLGPWVPPTGVVTLALYPPGAPAVEKKRRCTPEKLWHAYPMLTMYLSVTETKNYAGVVRADLRFRAGELAYARGKRFAQIVDAAGRIVDVLEVQL